MYPANNISVTSDARRWGLLLCALLILVSQLFLQLHSIDHLSDTDGVACEICLTGGTLEYAVVATIQDAYAELDDKTSFRVPVVNVYSDWPLSFQSRAPPLRNTNV